MIYKHIFIYQYTEDAYPGLRITAGISPAQDWSIFSMNTIHVTWPWW